MNDVVVRPDYELPVTLEDLSRFVLIGREKLVAVRAEIRAIDKVGLAKSVREQKLAEAQAISEAVLDAEVRIGQLMRDIPKATNGGANQYRAKATAVSQEQKVYEEVSASSQVTCASDGTVKTNVEAEPQLPSGQPVIDEPQMKTEPKTKYDVIQEAGFTPRQVQRFQELAEHPELVEQAKSEARANDDIVSRSLVLNMIKTQKKTQQIEQAKADIAKQAQKTQSAILHVGDGIGYVPAEPYDLLLTDPPYSTYVEDIEFFAKSWLPHALEYVKPTGSAYVFIGAYPSEQRAYLNLILPQHIKLKQLLIWTYKNTLGNNPKDRYKQNYQVCLFYRGVDAPDLECPLTSEQWSVQEVNAPDGRVGDRYHAWQKPMELAERFIRHSTKSGEVVFDPFACTGTFLLAAAKLGRRCYGFEINTENAELARSRGVQVM